MDKVQVKRAQVWINYAIGTWLAPEEIVSLPTVGTNVEVALARLDKAWNKKDKESALQQIRRIREDKLLSTLETGVAYLCCGHVLVEMEKMEEAEFFLRKAVIITPRSHAHFLAVLNWLLGILYWLKEKKRSQASNLWDDSIAYFTRLARDGSTDMKKKAWYEQQISIMQNAMRLAIEEDLLPPVDIISGVNLPPPPPVVFITDVDETSSSGQMETRWSRPRKQPRHTRRNRP